MIFLCSICKKEHPTTEKYLKNLHITPEERTSLREIYFKAYDLWSNNIDASNRDSFEKKLTRAEDAYFQTLTGVDIWLIPKSLKTVRKFNKNHLQCIDCW